MQSELTETLRIARTLNRSVDEIQATLQTVHESRRINALRGLARAREAIIKMLRDAVRDLAGARGEGDMISDLETKKFLEQLETEDVQRSAAQRRRPA